MGVDSEKRELLPIVLAKQGNIPDLGKELPLDVLQPVDGSLVSGRPELAAIIQPRLDQTEEEGK